MTTRIVGIIVGVLLIVLAYPTVQTLWNLDAKLDAQAKVQHEIQLGIGRIERKLAGE